MNGLLGPPFIAPLQLSGCTFEGATLTWRTETDESKNLIGAVADDLPDEKHVGKLMANLSRMICCRRKFVVRPPHTEIFCQLPHRPAQLVSRDPLIIWTSRAKPRKVDLGSHVLLTANNLKNQALDRPGWLETATLGILY